MRPILRASGSKFYSLLYLNSQWGHSRLKHLCTVIWGKDGKTTRQYQKSAIYLFVAGQSAISQSLGRCCIGWEMLMNESCRLRMSHVSYECVTSHLNTPMSHIYSHGTWRIHERYDSFVRDTSHMNTPMSHIYSYDLWLIHKRLASSITNITLYHIACAH